MPEESLEATEIKEKLDEAIERLEGGEAARNVRWMLYLSLATALMAVFAAIASLEAGAHSNEAIFEKNEAVLRQSQASDQWSYFQAKGLKSTFLSAQSQSLPQTSSELAQRLAQAAGHFASEQVDIERKARIPDRERTKRRLLGGGAVGFR